MGALNKIRITQKPGVPPACIEIINAETGEPITCVSRIETVWDPNTDEHFTKLWIHSWSVETDVTADVEITNETTAELVARTELSRYKQAGRALRSEGTYDVRAYRRIEQRDEDGTVWRGLLYRIVKEGGE